MCCQFIPKVRTTPNRWYHVKVLLKRFHLNCNTLGFHPQTQVRITYRIMVPCESTAKGFHCQEWFHLNCNIIRFHPQTQKLVLLAK